MDKLGKLSASSRSRAFQDLFADPKIAVGEVARFGLAGLASEVRAKGKAAASQTTRTNHQALCLMKTLPVLGLVPGSRVKAACASDGRGDAFSSIRCRLCAWARPASTAEMRLRRGEAVGRGVQGKGSLLSRGIQMHSGTPLAGWCKIAHRCRLHRVGGRDAR